MLFAERRRPDDAEWLVLDGETEIRVPEDLHTKVNPYTLELIPVDDVDFEFSKWPSFGSLMAQGRLVRKINE